MTKTIGLLAVAAALFLAACGSSNSSSSNSASTTSASSGGGSSTKTTSASTGGGKTVTNGGTIQMQDNQFSPATIVGKPGQTVKLTLKNVGTAQHNFKIDSQVKTGADADVPSGKTAHVTVKIPKSGSLQFYCEYHKSLGMVGTVKAS